MSSNFDFQGITISKADELNYLFRLFAPEKENVSIIFKNNLSDQSDKFEMTRDDFGYWQLSLNELPSPYYKFDIDGMEIPDPASHYQPDGVHQFSKVVDHDQFQWEDHEWNGIDWKDVILYELHPGTFTEEGNFEGIINKLPYLKRLGITAIEVMPVAHFPGKYNWGYDGALLYAVDNTYGTPDDFKRLVNTCHREGIAVILDVVYNHFGPEGSYIAASAPVFNERYSTPWGPAVNYDAPYNYGIRNYVVGNLRHWVENYHIDGFRLDAIDDIFDRGAYHIIEELQDTIDLLSDKLGKKLHLIAETAMHNPKITLSQNAGGYGLSGQWQDEFHHIMHVLMTGEDEGYYGDYQHGLEQLSKVFQGFVYQNEYSPHRKAVVGYPKIKNTNPDPHKLVVCIQNHDQIGNRLHGDRLAKSVPSDRIKTSVALMLLSPFTPMLFMGEEFASTTPFYFFVDFTSEDLKEAVREGRKRDYAERYSWDEEPVDPNEESTFISSKMNWNEMTENQDIFDFYAKLISTRKEIGLGDAEIDKMKVVYDTFMFSYNLNGMYYTILGNYGERIELKEFIDPSDSSIKIILSNNAMESDDLNNEVLDHNMIVLLRSNSNLF